MLVQYSCAAIKAPLGRFAFLLRTAISISQIRRRYMHTRFQDQRLEVEGSRRVGTGILPIERRNVTLVINLANGVPAFALVPDARAILICSRKFLKRTRSVSFILYRFLADK